jgi:hypothetical protein
MSNWVRPSSASNATIALATVHLRLLRLVPQLKLVERARGRPRTV